MLRAVSGRAMSPTFSTPIYYFKPYPGTPLTDEAEQYGYVPPKTLEEWANWDWYDADGPWVTPERSRLIERYKYYQNIAYALLDPWSRPFQKVSRWRVEANRFCAAPGEMIHNWIRHAPSVVVAASPFLTRRRGAGPDWCC